MKQHIWQRFVSTKIIIKKSSAFPLFRWNAEHTFFLVKSFSTNEMKCKMLRSSMFFSKEAFSSSFCNVPDENIIVWLNENFHMQAECGKTHPLCSTENPLELSPYFFGDNGSHPLPCFAAGREQSPPLLNKIT